MSSLKHQKWMMAPALAAALVLTACGGDGEYAAQEDTGPRSGPSRDFDPNEDSVFGEGGFTLNRILDGSILSGDRTPGESDAIPVNRYLWQASLDTLSFLPLSSTDPFTGVIATDWGSSPAQPGERFKVTAYMVRPALQASSLKVAVYRQLRNEDGIWITAPVDPNTARQLEDAILVRARQMRIAEIEGDATG